MSPALAAGLGTAALLALYTLVWVRQLKTRNASLIDAVWSLGTGALGAWYAAVGVAPLGVRIVLALMSAGWGVRLCVHLLLRMRDRPEDARYAALRREWGAQANARMLVFFWVQALVSLALSAGFLASAWHAQPPPAWAMAAAVATWWIALLGEGLADAQLERFRARADNHGRVCRSGLWRYSRHPNYFFETVHWMAYFFLAWGTPWTVVALAPPLVMALLLLKLSGVPLVEQQAARTRPEYAEYIRTTSALVPWPPRPWNPSARGGTP